jgi:hypothetical protein
MSFQGHFNAQNTTARGQNISKGQSQIILTQDNIVSTDGSNSTLRYVFSCQPKCITRGTILAINRHS